MYRTFDPSIIIPILIPVLLFALIIIIVVTVVSGKTKQAQITAMNQKSFEELAHELQNDHEAILSELAAVKESLNSIKKLMEDI